jgi:nicotinamidase-related amidase
VSSATALLVVDLQWAMFAGVGFGPIHDAEGLVKRVRGLIARARTADLPVVYVQHDGGAGTPVAKGSPGWAIHRDLAPAADDPVVEKRHCDSFLDTDLRRVLDARGVRRLVVVGAQSEFCVDTACRRAFSEGFEVTLVADGHSTFDLGDLKAEQIVSHHNAVLSDGFVTLLPAAEIDFGTQ